MFNLPDPTTSSTEHPIDYSNLDSYAAATSGQRTILAGSSAQAANQLLESIHLEFTEPSLPSSLQQFPVVSPEVWPIPHVNARSARTLERGK